MELSNCKVSRLDPQQVTSSAQPFPVSLSLFAPIFPKYLSPLCTLNTYTPQRLCAKYNQQFYAQSEDYCARSYCLREQSETDISQDPYGVDLAYMVNTTANSWRGMPRPEESEKSYPHPLRPKSSRRTQSTTYGVNNNKDYRLFMVKEAIWPVS